MNFQKALKPSTGERASQSWKGSLEISVKGGDRRPWKTEISFMRMQCFCCTMRYYIVDFLNRLSNDIVHSNVDEEQKHPGSAVACK